MSDGSSRQPVIVACCARSGSTLLRYILDTHPLICCPPELHLVRLHQQLRWVYMFTSGDRGEEGQGPGEAARQDAVERSRATVDGIMAEYCRRKGKPIWCEKSILTVDHFTDLDELLPQARVLCLYRHALDVVRSGLDVIQDDPRGYGFEPFLARHPRSPMTALVEHWCDKSARMLAYQRHAPERTLAVRYEDIVSNPQRTLDRIFGFLGLEWSTDLLERVFDTEHDLGPGDNNILQAKGIDAGRAGRGQQLDVSGLAPDTLAAMNRLLKTLAYTPVLASR